MTTEEKLKEEVLRKLWNYVGSKLTNERVDILVDQIHELYKKDTWLKGNEELPSYDDYYPTTTFTPRYQQARRAAWSKGQLKMLEPPYNAKSTQEWKK